MLRWTCLRHLLRMRWRSRSPLCTSLCWAVSFCKVLSLRMPAATRIYPRRTTHAPCDDKWETKLNIWWMVLVNSYIWSLSRSWITMASTAIWDHISTCLIPGYIEEFLLGLYWSFYHRVCRLIYPTWRKLECSSNFISWHLRMKTAPIIPPRL